MSRCVYCGEATNDSGLCPHHSLGHSDDWAKANRIMCDFIHRGIVVPATREYVLLEAA